MEVFHIQLFGVCVDYIFFLFLNLNKVFTEYKNAREIPTGEEHAKEAK